MKARIRRPILSKADFFPKYRNVSPEDWDKIRRQAEEKLIVAVLMQMLSPLSVDLWYDELRGIWQITQSCADGPRLERALAKQTRSALHGYYDSRTYHGRNSEQARKRDRKNGNAYRSTGFANQVRAQ